MSNYQPYPQQQYQSGPPQNQAPADSIGSWMLTIFIMAIPIAGFIYMLVIAFGGTQSVSKQNFARAYLIWMLIGIAIAIIAAILLAIAGVSFFAWFSDATSRLY
ncbi:hypothetical protein [Gulosibacter sp. 10]|uniref:hypothetical protein n=1 Tax=Gulosibacter sp. 10 TaxID=1255570 RepID=UPI00097EBE57|nr:hypothetical protein [Gulosibacter sp. 10]SJM51814.1 hypothetical protein FM112_02220 [Gulosibacter sp. 10]